MSGAERVRVLHVEPDSAVAERVASALGGESDLAVVGATTAARARTVLATEEIDCVVSAQALPDEDGLSLLSEVADSHPDVPFLLFAEEADASDLAMEALGTDGAEYLAKRTTDEQLDQLATRVRSAATYARMQRYLREREIPFRALVEYSTDLVTVIEPDGTLAYVSPSVKYLLGYAPRDLVGQRAFDLIHPDDREEVVEAFENMLSSPDPVPATEFRLRHADGEWRVVESRASNKLEHPAIEGMVVNTRDITPRKRTEERLRENKAKIERLHDTAAALAVCTEVDEICERTVAAAERILAFDICVVDIEEDGQLPARASRGLSPGETPDLSVEEGLAGKTYRTGESYLLDDTRESDVARPQGGYLSLLSIPIGDHGVFQAAATELDAFDEDDRELAELLVSHTTEALDRVDREARLREQSEQLAELADLDTELRAELGRAEAALADARNGSVDLDAVASSHDRLAALVDELETRIEGGDTDVLAETSQ